MTGYQKKASSSDLTRRKLMEAGTDVFAEAGYRAATVREIVRRAGVNQAAINYHFQGKEELYREVVRDAAQHMGSLRLADGPPEQQLRELVGKFLLPAAGEGAISLKYGKILAWEAVEPSGLLPAGGRDEITGTPQAVVMQVVRHFLPPDAPEHLAAWTGFWLLRQCAMVIEAEDMTGMVASAPAPEARQMLADFLCRMALGGLKALG